MQINYTLFRSKRDRRLVIRLPDNKLMNFSRFLWNYFGNRVSDDEHIHHKDINCLNDFIGNLQKLDNYEHMKLHRS